MGRVGGKSMDIVAENITKMKELFPEVFCEDKIDFEKLQEVLGKYIEDKEERYSFNWKGKFKSIRIGQTPSTGTLRPVKEESKNWNTTENLYIEGDNLEVLKLLQKTYHSKVKMIYIDPPYNTGNEFVYPDDFRDNIKNYLEITGQVDTNGRKMGTNPETSGRYHTDWLNMIYPRLRLARNLLSDDGVIFISIDDNEVSNLRKICDEVFGDENFVGCISRATGTTTGQDANKLGSSLDYCFVYSKSTAFYLKGLPLNEKDKKRFNNSDDKGRFSLLQLRKTGNADTREDRPNMFYPIIAPDGTQVYPIGPTGYLSRWRMAKESLQKQINENMIIWKNSDSYMVEHNLKENDANEDNIVVKVKYSVESKEEKNYVKSKWIPYVKYYLEGRTKQVSNLIQDIDGNKKGSLIIKDLFGKKGLFDNPKPLQFLEILLKISIDENSTVLDFFSGSSTTAHAVMSLNVEDLGRRKFIMVQLPEFTEKKSQAYKAGYKNICEIGKERIRRSGEKILRDNKDKEGIKNLDIGFKVFKLDSSNIKKWDVDGDNLEIDMGNMIDNFVPNRTEEDIVYEIMLKYGIDLTYPVEVRKIADKKVFSIGLGYLIICLDDAITLEVVDGIVNLKDELDPKKTRVIFKDNGFKNDSVKTNAIQILRRNKIKEIMSI